MNSDPLSVWRNQVEEELHGAALEIRDLILRQTDPVKAILEAAKNSQADLIMMGKYRHTRLRQRLFGSKVDMILHQAECPIWLA